MAKSKTPEETKEQQCQAHTVHGGASATRSIREGMPMRGIAADEEQGVRVELALSGRQSMVLDNAIRLQTATNLYWAAVCKAAEDRDLAALDRYIARYGWLAGCSLRAWAQVKTEEEAPEAAVTAIDVLAAIKEKKDGDEGG